MASVAVWHKGFPSSGTKKNCNTYLAQRDKHQTCASKATKTCTSIENTNEDRSVWSEWLEKTPLGKNTVEGRGSYWTRAVMRTRNYSAGERRMCPTNK